MRLCSATCWFSPGAYLIGSPFPWGRLGERPGGGSVPRHYAHRPALGVDVAELYWGTTAAFVESRIDHLAVEVAAEQVSADDEVAP